MLALAPGFMSIDQLSDKEILARELLVKLEKEFKAPVQVSVYTPDSISCGAAKDFIGKFDNRVCEVNLGWMNFLSPADLFKYGDSLFFSGTYRRFSELAKKVGAANSARWKRRYGLERVVRRVYPRFRSVLPLQQELDEHQRFYSLDYLAILAEPHVSSNDVYYAKKIGVVSLKRTEPLDLAYCTGQRVKDSANNAALTDAETLATEILRSLEQQYDSAVQLTVDTPKTAGRCSCNHEGRIYFGDFGTRAVSVTCDNEALANSEHYEGLAQLAGNHPSLLSLEHKIRCLNRQLFEKHRQLSEKQGLEERKYEYSHFYDVQTYDVQTPFIMADPVPGSGSFNWGVNYRSCVARIEFERIK